MSRTPTRNDILLLILGGDMSSYPLAREFHEAFGLKSICISPAPIAIIRHSKFIDTLIVESTSKEDLGAAIAQVSRDNPGKKIVLMANNDAVVNRVVSMVDTLPENVVFSFPPQEVVERVSNKIDFAELCAEHGVDAPQSEIVHVGGSEPIPPTTIGFPLIAKPAVSSAEYFKLFEKGFKKVYFLQSQDELDELWRDLRAESFSGDFLVQELIGGDDTYVDMITTYVNQAGKVTLFVSSQVLLEDHAPTLFGNPVAMITRPMPEEWDKVERMLTAIGWRGFANFDMKRDPKTGRVIYMDFNPRIGNNSYYACVGGANPMRALVNDLVDGNDEVIRIDRNGLYTRARPKLIRHYLSGALREEFDRIVAKKAVGNPMRYKHDSLMARIYGRLMELNYDRKFARYYPEPTDTSF